MHKYKINTAVKFNCGFPLSIENVMAAIHGTNNALENCKGTGYLRRRDKTGGGGESSDTTQICPGIRCI